MQWLDLRDSWRRTCGSVRDTAPDLESPNFFRRNCVSTNSEKFGAIAAPRRSARSDRGACGGSSTATQRAKECARCPARVTLLASGDDRRDDQRTRSLDLALEFAPCMIRAAARMRAGFGVFATAIVVCTWICRGCNRFRVGARLADARAARCKRKKRDEQGANNDREAKHGRQAYRPERALPTDRSLPASRSTN